MEKPRVNLPNFCRQSFQEETRDKPGHKKIHTGYNQDKTQKRTLLPLLQMNLDNSKMDKLRLNVILNLQSANLAMKRIFIN